jgi:hypothetical protein
MHCSAWKWPAVATLETPEKCVVSWNLAAALGVKNMRGKEFRGIAQSLAAMALSSRIAEDLETLASLSDGSVLVNLLAGSALTANGTDVPLQICLTLWSWLDQQSSERGFRLTAIEKAEILIHVDTSRIPTNRNPRRPPKLLHLWPLEIPPPLM